MHEHNYIQPKDWIGKTITDVKADAINVAVFQFSDGTSIALEIEGAGNGISGMFQCTDPSCQKTDP